MIVSKRKIQYLTFLMDSIALTINLICFTGLEPYDINFFLIFWTLIQIVLVLQFLIFKFWFVTKCFYLSSYYGSSSCFVPILSSHTMICGCKIYDDFCKMSFCRWHNLEQLSGQHFLTFFTQEKFVLEQQQ